MDLFWNSGKTSLEYFQKANFLKDFTGDTISTLSRNQKSGFLHVIQDILEVFDELRVRPFIDFLMGCVVRLMVNYTPSTNEESSDNAASSTPENKENVSVHQDQVKCLLVFVSSVFPKALSTQSIYFSFGIYCRLLYFFPIFV